MVANITDISIELAAVLLRAGALVEHWRLPLELTERPDQSAPISYDDLIDLHDALEQLPTADWVRQR